MLTIFTVPKPFEGHIGVIQRNAIRSWLQLRPQCEIILFGDERGTREVAEELGVRHVPTITCNDHGTPLISDVFARAQKEARGDLLCYTNADIVFLGDFLDGVTYVAKRRRRFLLSGRRWNLDVVESLDFTNGWEEKLRSLIAAKGELYDPAGMDYFVFRRGELSSIPPFAIGRAMWDNWMMYNARKRRLAVVDATQRISVVHQNHDYAHLRNGQHEAWKGLEAQRNFELAGGDGKYAFTLRDATWLLTPRGLQMADTAEHIQRRWEVLPVLHPRLRYYLVYGYCAVTTRLAKLREVLAR